MLVANVVACMQFDIDKGMHDCIFSISQGKRILLIGLEMNAVMHIANANIPLDARRPWTVLHQVACAHALQSLLHNRNVSIGML